MLVNDVTWISEKRCNHVVEPRTPVPMSSPSATMATHRRLTRVKSIQYPFSRSQLTIYMCSA